jgi:uncharacterized protein (TIGR04255 family)
MVAEHPQLERPPLVEALFELRFQPNLAYGLLPGQMLDLLRNAFPTAIELNAANLPVDLPSNIQFPPIVRHRFSSEDGHRMFQLGSGVLSVNHTAYERFAGLREDVERVLTALLEIGAVGRFQRLGLRYINRIEVDQRARETFVSARDTLPPVLAERIRQRRLIYSVSFGNDQMNVGLVDLTFDDRPVLDIDLDYFLPDASAFPVDVEHTLIWLQTAHDNVYEVFMSLLAPEYLEEIR